MTHYSFRIRNLFFILKNIIDSFLKTFIKKKNVPT